MSVVGKLKDDSDSFAAWSTRLAYIFKELELYDVVRQDRDPYEFMFNLRRERSDWETKNNKALLFIVLTIDDSLISIIKFASAYNAMRELAKHFHFAQPFQGVYGERYGV